MSREDRHLPPVENGPGATASTGARRTIRAVALDLDGTLLDTVPGLAASLNGMLRDLGLRSLGEPTVRRLVGQGVARLVADALAEVGGGEAGDAALATSAMAAFSRHYAIGVERPAPSYPGAISGLERLRASGRSLACITNKAERFTLPLIHASGLDGYFDLVICGDTLSTRKPDPLPVLHACSVFGVMPPQLLMIGDSEWDLQAARAAGSPVFCVDYGYAQDRSRLARDADAMVSSILDAAMLLEGGP